MADQKKPSEMTYRDYKHEVQVSAEAAIEAMEDYPEEYANAHEAVSYAIQGDPMIHNRGYRLATLLYSDSNADNPDYALPWDEVYQPNTSRSYESKDDDRMTADEAQTHMARICYEDDVTKDVKRVQEHAEEEDLTLTEAYEELFGDD